MQEKIEKQLRVVDVPGHPRISKGIFARHCDRAKAIVFLVDSVDFMVQKDQVSTALNHVPDTAVLCYKAGAVLVPICDVRYPHSSLSLPAHVSLAYLLRAFRTTQVAEHLYDMLACRAISSRKVPVLLAANKVDCEAKAHSVEFIKKRLEKALDQLCITRADIDAEGGKGQVPLGSTFLHLKA